MTGKGAQISVSMFDVMADWLTVPLLNHEGGKSPKRLGLAHPSIAPYGVFRTGDGGWFDTEGRLHWEGRLNDIIKTGGANVSPIEIDSVIKTCPGVKVTQTVGVPHETLGELVVTCIVPHADAKLDEDGIRGFAREQLASFKVPRRVLFFAESDLELTGSAKIKTADLKALVVKRLEVEAA